MTITKSKLTGILLGAQVVFVILFGLFLEYEEEASPKPNTNKTNHSLPEASILNDLYPMYQDVHVMMLVGFGFLMQFLKKFGFSSLGFTFLLLCYIIQWSLLINGWFGSIAIQKSKISINLESLLHADFAAATILISFGVILGVASPIQAIVMATLEVVFFNINFFIGTQVLATLDVGGTILIHLFGAYFGLAVARVLYRKQQINCEKESSNYRSDIAAMIGTTFLWVFWPSFNSAATSGLERHRAVLNTVLSLAACTVVTFAVTSWINKKGKLNMAHIQNATLSGGVVIGASADLVVNPFAAVLIGSVSGVMTTLSFHYIQPFLLKKIKLHDTCGVHNLHGLTGIVGGIISAIIVATASKETYMGSYDKQYGLTSEYRYHIHLSPPATQIVAIVVTLGIALLSGSITGFLLKLPIWDNLSSEEFFDDETFWLVEDTEQEDHMNGVCELTKEEAQEKL